jgi:putative membrane protein
MDGWGGWGMALFGWLFMALIIVLVVWLIWTTTRSDGSRRPVSHSTAREVLDERYAHGEIEREEYLQRKEDLRA